MSTQANPPRLVVTGGGSGIGRAVCAGAVSRGWSVLAVDRSTEALDVVAAELGIATAACDVTDESAVRAVAAAAESTLGGVPDRLVAAAGIYEIRDALETTAEDFLRVVRVNDVGTFLIAREVARGIRAAGCGGRMAFLASTAAFLGDRGEPGVAYCASKGAIVSMTHQLAVEWAPLGIRVNAVSPGVIDTPMLRLMDDPVRGQEYLQDGVPLTRLGTADEVAAACLFLLDEASAYITGTVLPVDGGSTIV